MNYTKTVPGETTGGSPPRRTIGQQLRVVERAGRLRPSGVPRKQPTEEPGLEGPKRPPQREKVSRDQLATRRDGKGETPAAREGVECHSRSDHPPVEDRGRPLQTVPAPVGRPLFRGPFLYTLRAQIGSDVVKKCLAPNSSSQIPLFCMRKKHKKPVAGPADVTAKSKVLRGEGLWSWSPSP